VRQGEEAELWMDASKLHLFDAESGKSIRAEGSGGDGASAAAQAPASPPGEPTEPNQPGAQADA
jgi:hypothetical protein